MNFIATKLYIPPRRASVVPRPRLTERLNTGLDRKLTVISAPAGFGKTTLVSEWNSNRRSQVSPPRPRKQVPELAWLSLDASDNDPARFLTYLIAAMQTVVPNIGASVLPALQSPQPPTPEFVLTTLLNELAAVPADLVLVLDDYHVIDSGPIDTALTFLIEHMPPHMHLLMLTREDPDLPLARLRVRDQLTELRAADLRFTPAEAADFLNRVMGLELSSEDVAALETRTEGWIAGLQMAALALQGQTAPREPKDTAEFIASFTGSHRFVLDYLLHEVLRQQPERVQNFLLGTSILDRLCGPLCDAVLLEAPGTGQTMLEQTERANLFSVPLDNERRWYRYHHLFADLLRQRLATMPDVFDTEQVQGAGGRLTTAPRRVNVLHIRASEWYEKNGLDLEAFRHAVAAEDVDRAERLSVGKGMPLHFRGAVMTVIEWLASLPVSVLSARPWLWLRHAQLLLITGQTIGVEEKLAAAEAALQDAEPGAETRSVIGQIAAARATLALTRYSVPDMLAQSRRALEYLPADNVTARATAYWAMGFALFILQDYAAAEKSYRQAVEISRAPGGMFTAILGTIGLGNVQEVQSQLKQAVETYRTVLEMSGDQPHQIIYEPYLGLARILTEWNDLDAAEQHGLQSLTLARQYESIIDRFIVCELVLARVKRARGDLAGASVILAQADQAARRQNFVYRIPEVAAEQVLLLLERGEVTAAAHLSEEHNLPATRARVLVAQGDPSAALALLEPMVSETEKKGLADEHLRLLVLTALALDACGDKDGAVQRIEHALVLAEPGGYIRLFLDEGGPMHRLLSETAAHGNHTAYLGQLLDAFRSETGESNGGGVAGRTQYPASEVFVEALSPRELEILALIARGLSNREISETLFLALDTVKGYNRNIFAKLQVARRTEAVARARELGLL